MDKNLTDNWESLTPFCTLIKDVYKVENLSFLIVEYKHRYFKWLDERKSSSRQMRGGRSIILITGGPISWSKKQKMYFTGLSGANHFSL